MKFSIAVSVLSACLMQTAAAMPASEHAEIAARASEHVELMKRTSCQICNIKGLEAGPACCSASCFIQHGDIHGGHCDANDYCICN